MRDLTTGKTFLQSKNLPVPENCIAANVGRVTLRNTLTNETFSHPADQPYPSNCVHTSTGFVTLRDLTTGKCFRHPKGAPVPPNCVNPSVPYGDKLFKPTKPRSRATTGTNKFDVIREALKIGPKTFDELLSLCDTTRSSLKSMLSDIKNPKYACGPAIRHKRIGNKYTLID